MDSLSIILLVAGIVITAAGYGATNNTIHIIIGFLLILIALYATYSKLIQLKNKTKEAYSSIDVQLKKRYDLIPNILTIANKFMEHEKGLLEEITRLRNQALNCSNISQKQKLDNLIQDKMSQFNIALENYPQLKSDKTMIIAIQTYNEIEEHICAARRFYNSAVNELNNAVEIFPSSLIASLLGIRRKEYFETPKSERQSISASEYLK